MLISLAITKF